VTTQQQGARGHRREELRFRHVRSCRLCQVPRGGGHHRRVWPCPARGSRSSTARPAAGAGRPPIPAVRIRASEPLARVVELGRKPGTPPPEVPIRSLPPLIDSGSRGFPGRRSCGRCTAGEQRTGARSRPRFARARPQLRSSPTSAGHPSRGRGDGRSRREGRSRTRGLSGGRREGEARPARGRACSMGWCSLASWSALRDPGARGHG